MSYLGPGKEGPGGVRTREMLRQELAKAETGKEHYPGEHAPRPGTPPPPPPPLVEKPPPPATGVYPPELLAKHPGAAQWYVGEEAKKREKELEWLYQKEYVERVLAGEKAGIYPLAEGLYAVKTVTGEVKLVEGGALGDISTGITWETALGWGLVTPEQYLTHKQQAAYTFRLQYAKWEKATYPKLTQFETLWGAGKYEEALGLGLQAGLISETEYKKYLGEVARYQQLEKTFTSLNKLAEDIYGAELKAYELGLGIAEFRTEILKKGFEIEALKQGWKVTGWEKVGVGKWYVEKMGEKYVPTLQAPALHPSFTEFVKTKMEDLLKWSSIGPTAELFKPKPFVRTTLEAGLAVVSGVDVLVLQVGRLLGQEWAYKVKPTPLLQQPTSVLFAPAAAWILGKPISEYTREQYELYKERIEQHPGMLIGDIFMMWLGYKATSAAYSAAFKGIAALPYGAKIIAEPAGRIAISTGIGGLTGYALSAGDLEVALKSALVAGAMSLTFEAVRAFPGRIKYGEVTYPVEEGEKVAYRGIYAQWKEKAYPLIGRAEGRWALGTPTVSFEDIYLGRGWTPYTPLETKIVTQNLAALGYSPEEIQKILLTWKLGIAVKGLPPPYMQEKIVAAEHFANPEKAREVFLQWAKDWESQLQQVYGSSTAYAQMPPKALAERGAPIHDYDVMMKGLGNYIDDLLSRLTAAGETVWISPGRPTLIETPMGHAVDIHTYLEAMGYKVPEGAWGITFQQPPVKIGEIEAMRLGEFATRKMGSILTLRPEGAYPEAYRMKDITDFFISAKYLLGGVKTETLTQLQTLWGVSAEEMAKATISLPPYHYAAPPSISMPYAPIVISSLVVPSFISKPISPLVSAKLPSILSIPYTPVSPISERSLSQYYSQMYRPMASVLSYPTVSKISYPPIPSYAKPSPPSISYPIKKYKIPSYPIPSIPSYPYRPSIPSYPPYSPPPYTPPSYPPYSPPTYTPPYYPPYTPPYLFTPPHPGLKIEEVGYPRFKWFERLHPIFEPHEVARMMGVRIPKVKVSPQLKHAEGIARLIGTVPRQKVRPLNVMFGKKPQRRYPIKRKWRKKHKRGRLNRGIQQLM